MQTLMSTDIFKTTNTGLFGNTVELGALRLYITISLPLVVLTLLAWYSVYWWETRKEELYVKSNAFKRRIQRRKNSDTACNQLSGQQGFPCLMALLFWAANI